MKAIKWRFTKPPDFDAVPEKPGVYLISTQQTDNEYEVKYVGQADNLHERAKTHWSKNEKNEPLKKHIAEKYVMKFSFSELSDKEERDGIELFLYKTYDPPFNKNTPPGNTVIRCSSLPEVRKHH